MSAPANDEQLETARSKIYTALVAAQKAARAVGLDSKNDHHRYPYASAESVIDEGRLALNSAGLSLFGANYHVFNADGDRYVRVTYVLAHESGNSLTFERWWAVIVQRGRELDKAIAGALTTGLSYALRDLLLLPRDNELAAMDRRPEPSAAREPERRQESQREPERAPESDRRPKEPPLEDLPARESDRGRDELPASASAWDEALERVKRGESIGAWLAEMEESGQPALKLEARVALSFISRAYKATDEGAVAKIGAEIRKSADLSHGFQQIALDEIKPAYAKVRERAA